MAWGTLNHWWKIGSYPLSRQLIIEYVTEETETVTLWRPTGPEELALVEASGWRQWQTPPAGSADLLPNAQWAVRHHDRPRLERQAVWRGYVTRFQVRRSLLDHYQVRQVGGQTILESWIPAGDLGALNASIVGKIELIAECH